MHRNVVKKMSFLDCSIFVELNFCRNFIDLITENGNENYERKALTQYKKWFFADRYSF